MGLGSGVVPEAIFIQGQNGDRLSVSAYWQGAVAHLGIRT